jgi:quercetin dioxygenase-like cupin family protein
MVRAGSRITQEEIGGFDVRTSVFSVVDGQVESEVAEVPPWADPDAFGQEAAEIHHSPNGTTVLYRIPAGCTVPIHAGPNYALCQIVSGRGTLVLPSGKEFHYQGPELFIFEPGALHGWRDVVEDTYLTVCEVMDES